MDLTAVPEDSRTVTMRSELSWRRTQLGAGPDRQASLRRRSLSSCALAAAALAFAAVGFSAANPPHGHWYVQGSITVLICDPTFSPLAESCMQPRAFLRTQ